MNSMKTIFLALATAFVLFSCSPKTTGNKGIIPENANELASENLPFAIDSLQLQDSISVGKTLKLYSSSKVLLFPNITNKPLLDSIYRNAGITLENYSKELIKNINSFDIEKVDYLMNTYLELIENLKAKIGNK